MLRTNVKIILFFMVFLLVIFKVFIFVSLLLLKLKRTIQKNKILLENFVFNNDTLHTACDQENMECKACIKEKGHIYKCEECTEYMNCLKGIKNDWVTNQKQEEEVVVSYDTDQKQEEEVVVSYDTNNTMNEDQSSMMENIINECQCLDDPYCKKCIKQKQDVYQCVYTCSNCIQCFENQIEKVYDNNNDKSKKYLEQVIPTECGCFDDPYCKECVKKKKGEIGHCHSCKFCMDCVDTKRIDFDSTSVDKNDKPNKSIYRNCKHCYKDKECTKCLKNTHNIDECGLYCNKKCENCYEKRLKKQNVKYKSIDTMALKACKCSKGCLECAYTKKGKIKHCEDCKNCEDCYFRKNNHKDSYDLSNISNGDKYLKERELVLSMFEEL